jgi:hypothetical protein
LICSPSTSITVDGSAGVCSVSITTSMCFSNASRISSASRHGSWVFGTVALDVSSGRPRPRASACAIGWLVMRIPTVRRL